jgi:hypothetical protein
LKTHNTPDILISQYNPNNNPKETSENYRFRVTNLIAECAPQNMFYQMLSNLVKELILGRRKRIPRKYLALAVDCHIDTISTHNMTLSNNDILEIQRGFKEVNIYSSQYLSVLGEIFGFIKPIFTGTASLFTSLFNFNLSYNNEDSNSSFEKLEFLPERGNVKEIGAILGQFTPSKPTRTLSIPRKPYKNESLYSNINSYNSLNTHVLFNRVDDADQPFGNKKQRDFDMTHKTVPFKQSYVGTSPLFNQPTVKDIKPKEYSEVDIFENKQKFESNISQRKFSWLAEATQAFFSKENIK